MRTWYVITKSVREQFRSFWILLLTLVMGPFFVMVYYLITESQSVEYDILVVNLDKGVSYYGIPVRHGALMLDILEEGSADSLGLPLVIRESPGREQAVKELERGRADAVVVLPAGFSCSVRDFSLGKGDGPEAEFIGDLTNTGYLISAVWAEALIGEYMKRATGQGGLIEVQETAIGASGKLSDFEIAVPGLLIIAVIMLMFTASIAFITEVEQRTILRLRLSRLRAWEYLAGISAVQLLIGMISLVLTLATAIAFGYSYHGSTWLILLIATLCSLSILAFSLVIAAGTRTSNEILIVGNFPLFLFMFFSGAAFPISNKPMFSILGYDIHPQGLMSPAHAIEGLRKVLVHDAPLSAILPELSAIMALTVIYFLWGGIWFRERHMKLR